MTKRKEDQKRKTAFAEEQIAYTLLQADAGMAVSEICQKVGISEQTSFYNRTLRRRIIP